MKGKPAEFIQLFINKQMDMFFGIIYKSEGRDRSGFNPQVFHKPLVRCKCKLPLPQALFQIMDIKLTQMFKDHQVMTVPLMVPEKDILASS